MGIPQQGIWRWGPMESGRAACTDRRTRGASVAASRQPLLNARVPAPVEPPRPVSNPPLLAYPPTRRQAKEAASRSEREQRSSKQATAKGAVGPGKTMVRPLFWNRVPVDGEREGRGVLTRRGCGDWGSVRLHTSPASARTQDA